MTYLAQARNRPNLHVQADCTTRKVLLESGKAVGVEVERAGVVERYLAEETVLCAGAIGTPQILMLSGIGPAPHLQEVGVTVNHHLPGVGGNLRDHPTTDLYWELLFSPTGHIHWHQAGLRYTAAGSSLFNDMIVYIGGVPDSAGGKGDYLFVRPTVNLAVGKGELRLRSDRISDQPLLNYRYFEELFDRERQREAIRLCTVLIEEHPAFRSLCGRVLKGPGDGLQDDEALDRWILANADTGHHTSSTCKMGPPSDPMAVADQSGRVHGLDGLRIVDASLMPDSVRANINATVMMMAEKVAAEMAGEN